MNGANLAKRISFGLVPLPDLQISEFSPQPVAFGDRNATVSYTVQNLGPGDVPSGSQWSRELWLTDDGVLDGAVFSLSQANDPEVLVQLELNRDSSDGVANWSYSLARMSTTRMKVRLDDKVVWEADGYWRQPRSPNDPYMENFGDTPKPGDSKTTD